MNKFLKSILSFGLVAIIALMVSPTVLFAEQIRVTGVGTVTFSPDFVRLQLGVSNFDADLGVALAVNNEAIANILDGLADLGFTAENIQTTNLSVWRTWNPEPAGEFSEGFNVENTINITIEDLELLNVTIEAAVELGVTNIWGITFDSVYRNEHYRAALALAVEDAMDKAAVLAAAVGQPLGRLTAVNEIGDSLLWGGFGVVSPVGIQRDALAQAGVQVIAGELSIAAQVELIFDSSPQ